MHRVLRQAAVSERYRYALARDGYLEFWKPQLQAISKGLLRRSPHKNFIVSLPTGAGKTILAELAILTAFDAQQGKWGVYVAPSRALVNQVSNDLRHRLSDCGVTIRPIIAGAEQSAIALDAELELMQLNRTVTVTTPEKLDAYYRNARDVFNTCRIVIFDEVHKISEPDRGPIIESLITRFRALQPDIQIVLMSGAMSNAEELAEWLGPEDTEIVVEERRPTRQIRRVAVRQSGRTESAARAVRKGRVRRVEYRGGIVIVHEDEDLKGEFEVQLPNFFRGWFTERQPSETARWAFDRNGDKSTSSDHAVDIARVVARAGETVLVFVRSIASAERCCRIFDYQDNADIAHRRQLASFLEAELYPGHELAEFCQRGIAYHHAQLPPSVQRAVEYGLEQGWLRVVFATSTLREGLNTPATTVILAGHTFYNDITDEPEDIREADFANLAGRAGRPRTDTEGRIFLVPDTLAMATAAETGKKYFLMGESALRVTSQLRALADAVRAENFELRRLRGPQQALVLALQAAGLADEEGAITFIGSSLWSTQEGDDDVVRQTAVAVAGTLAKTADEIGREHLDLASKLGLSLTSAEVLIQAMTENADLFRGLDMSPESRRDRVRVILTASLQLEEVHYGALGRFPEAARHLDALMKWIGGDDYNEILRAAQDLGALPETAGIGSAVKYCSQISAWLSWSFGASCSVLAASGDDLDPFIGLLPLLIKYGVPDAPSAYVSLLGVSDRHAAKILGEKFLATGRLVTVQEVSRWLDELSQEYLEGIFPVQNHHLRADLLRRQVLRRWPTPRLYVTGQFRAHRLVAPGTVANCQWDSQQLVLVAEDNEVLGEVLLHRGMNEFLQGNIISLMAVVTEGAPKAQRGRIALIRTQLT